MNDRCISDIHLVQHFLSFPYLTDKTKDEKYNHFFLILQIH